VKIKETLPHSLTHRSVTCLLLQYELESQKMREENRRLSADAQREMSKLEMQLQFKVRLTDTFITNALLMMMMITMMERARCSTLGTRASRVE